MASQVTVQMSDDELDIWTDAAVRDDLTPDQLAWFQSPDMLERFSESVRRSRLRAEDRSRDLKVELQREYADSLRRGSSHAHIQRWHTIKAQLENEIRTQGRIINAAAALHGKVKLLLKQANIQRTAAERVEYEQRRKDAAKEAVAAPDVRSLVTQLCEALAPLASLEYLISTTARDDTHLAAYRAVRLKVADIRTARAAWLAAQAFLGSAPENTGATDLQ